jgi:hypothetical protein
MKSAGKSGKPRKRKTAESGPLVQYDQLNFNDVVFNIGDVVSLNGTSYDEFGRIDAISRQGLNKPKIRVIRFYSRYNLEHELEVVPQYISEYELFETDDVHELDCTYLGQTVTVVTLDEYSERSEAEDNLFYTRAKYLKLAKEFDPPLR